LNPLSWGIPAPDPSAAAALLWLRRVEGSFGGRGRLGQQLAGREGWRQRLGSESFLALSGCGKRAGFCKPRKAASSGRAELVCPGQGLSSYQVTCLLTV